MKALVVKSALFYLDPTFCKQSKGQPIIQRS